jgi:hypothetical protein
VKSMAQYPEARDQYQRILTVVSKMQESQVSDQYPGLFLEIFNYI